MDEHCMFEPIACDSSGNPICEPVYVTGAEVGDSKDPHLFCLQYAHNWHNIPLIDP